MSISNKEDVLILTLESRENKAFFKKIHFLTKVGVGVTCFLGNEPMKIE